ncbi:MAG: HNH endonuclease [Clostridia bacterium]|nr:HNH endonuclease [Clostridia bacterium]
MKTRDTPSAMRSASLKEEEREVMYETDDLTGREYGSLKVLWMHKRSRNGGASWVCRCSCGRVCIVDGKRLLKGEKTNCGDCNYGLYSFHSDYVECVLPTGDKFQIDPEDYYKVAKYKWVKTFAGYFVASLGRRSNHIFLHRLVMNLPAGEYVDHIDGNKGNCRKKNMRPCSRTENNRNTGNQKNNQCGYKGVHWAADRGKWRTDITVNRKHIHLGSFDSPIEAAQAYDQAAIFYFGEFARTNEMLGNYERLSSDAKEVERSA